MIAQSVISCGKLLIDKGLTIAFAESATAGRMAAEFSLVPDAGKFLKGGLVCYDAFIKSDLLKVPKDLINEFTPESLEVTCAIAEGLQPLVPADIYIGTTGLTTPGGSERNDKPVGTMFVSAIWQGKIILLERMFFSGSPKSIVSQTIEATANLLEHKLKEILATENSLSVSN